MNQFTTWIKGHAKPCLFVCLVALVVALDYAFGWSTWLRNEQGVQALQLVLEQNYALAVAAYCLVTVVGCVLLALPGVVFAVVAAALFGPWWGTLWCIVAATVGAVVSFVVGRYFLKDAVKPWASRNKMVRDLLFSGSERNAVMLLAVTRLIPVFPYNIQNFAYGVTDIKLSTYTWCSLVFMIPGTALYTFSTAGLLDAQNRWLYLGIAVMLAIAVAAAGVLLRDKDALLKLEKAHYPFVNWRHAKADVVLFPGCNAVSFFPRTVDALADLMADAAQVGIAYDCCGKPLVDYGMVGEDRMLSKLEKRLAKAGVKELVCVCPNCYEYLSGRLPVRVTGVYEKLQQLSLLREGALAGEGVVFPPCPDKRNLAWLEQLKPAFGQMPQVATASPCCGWGKSGVGKTSEQLAEMGKRCLGPADTYVYCASCAGCLSAHTQGDQRVLYALVELLGTNERPQVSSSLANRAKAVLR